MARKDDRQAAAAALLALDLFQAVYSAPVRTFDGQSPVVLVLGATQRRDQLARAVAVTGWTLTATLYTLNEDGNAEAENQHDDLVAGAMDALHGAGFVDLTSDAAPDGAPLRNIDGRYYRTERMSFRRGP